MVHILDDLTRRVCEAEVMDQPGLDAREHRRALAGLARLNFLSRSVGILWPRVAEVAHRVRRPLRILDLATGGGDVPCGLWRRARRAGLAVEILGVDFSDEAVDVARARADAMAAEAGLRFARLDVLREDLPDAFDVVMCSLFLHHLREAEVVALLERMARAARERVLVNDLVRSRGGYMLATSAAWLVGGSYVVRTDAPLSVRAAFTTGELQRLAQAAGLDHARITRHAFCRMLLEWNCR